MASDIQQAATPQPSRSLGALVGLLVTAVAVSTGHLVAAVTVPEASPVIAVGQAAIDATPEWLKSFAIRTFGSNDKRVLLTGIFLTLAVIALAVGVLSARRRWVGFAGIAGLTLLALAAEITRPTATSSYAVPAMIAGIAAAASYALLLRSMAPRHPAPDEASASGEPTLPADLDRRRFLVTGAALGAAVVAAGGAARFLSGNAQAAADRSALSIPAPVSKASALPADASFNVAGISTFYTPVEQFYRVDTALLVPRMKVEDWRLDISGMVDRPLTLSFQDLIARDLIERDITLNCVSNPVGGRYIGTTRWVGAPLLPLLNEVGIQPGATQIASRSVDGFTAGTPLAQATDGRDAMLAISMDGQPLPFEHGFPVRMLVPGLYGYESATKWITSIELTDDSFQSYWVKRSWAKAVDVKTASRIDTPTNGGRENAGPVDIAGVAWAQHRGIQGVQVQIDNRPWIAAELGSVDSPDTWRQWKFRWNATPGSHLIRVRAIDGTGAVQTGVETPPFPSGATGYDTVSIQVS
ncbi:MAG TPA: molybdopterin-dependent oxidoreductase [Actinomycetota bacterium]|jgi:DMSO/TMAO reductase YedYZ molybdopterin-dependent catalytic subunit|nr:molybdopterin-dependent oxidoreductase [Actinomycetota bacterium]